MFLFLAVPLFTLSLFTNLQAMLFDSWDEDFVSNSLYILAQTKKTLADEGNFYATVPPSLDEPLTPEIVRNDYWQKMANKSPEEKKDALQYILKLNFTNYGYPELRRHIAAAVIIAGANPNIKKIYYHSQPLYTAILHNDFHLADLLLYHKANLEIKENTGESCILFAKTVKIAERLVAAGARMPIWTRNSDTTLLGRCMSEGYEPELITFYRSKGLRPLGKDKRLRTSLHQLALNASFHSSKEVEEKCNLLLNGLADISIIELCNAKNCNGHTPLMILQEIETPEESEKVLYNLLQRRLSEAKEQCTPKL